MDSAPNQAPWISLSQTVASLADKALGDQPTSSGLGMVGRKSPLSLYDKSLVSFDEKGGYNQADAEGFIKLNALRLRVRAKAQPND